ncbi:short-chain dehydrogenase TIC 32, chloroplastic-like [Argentina anserina]|uniref:short-chain dehydrogenase TIC 32, chloroplastic-like n=1 Tax=Argentina anserina TaxID=57926 RepID=UPI0021763EBF|nr:short-chain dehydrogenase TIC 32, chloroplastic-like [Potentilla anserina]
MLSAEALKQVSCTKFPSRRAVSAFKKQQSKLRSFLQEVYYIGTKDETEEIDPVLLDTKDLDLPTKALELKRVFGTVQIQVKNGATTTGFLALNPQVKGISGEYYVDCNIAKPHPKANDADLAKRLWEFSLSLTNLK